jgi:hypothetical protein
MRKEDKKALVRALRTLLKGKKRSSTHGICSNVYRLTGVESREYDHLFKKWKHFSGSIMYPVPAVEYSNERYEYRLSNRMWSGKYGELRKKLCRHLIRELTKTKRKGKSK